MRTLVMKTWTEQISQQVAKEVAAAKFPQKSKEITDILIGAIRQIDNYQQNPYHLHKGTRPTRNGFGADLPKGQRDEAMLRNLLISAVYRSWEIGRSVIPVINNKGYPATPFVIFAERIFAIVGIGKIEDHLEEFQSFRAQSFTNFQVTQQDV